MRRNGPWWAQSLRAAAATLLLVMGTATIGRGYCPMRLPPVSGAPDSQEHDCCKKGITGARPGCCHANSGPGAQALSKAALLLATIAPSARVLDAPFELRESRHSVRWLVAVHSPPPSVLRI